MKNICIVSSDISGPVKNGGVGTACYHLAREMVKFGLSVSILFANSSCVTKPGRWERHYANMGISYYQLPPYSGIPLTDKTMFFQDSYNVLQHLKEHSYQFIHFTDFMGIGFHTIQAKRTIGLFANTVITVTVHSPYRWILEGMEQWDPDPINGLKRDYMEQYCYAHADILVSPSQYMLNWMEAQGWCLARDIRIIPNCFSDKPFDITYSPDKSHLIFFGRLEKRKGLDVFCEAVLKLNESQNKINCQQVTFLGKIGTVNGRPANDYIDETLDKSIKYEIYADFDKDQAMAYILEHRGLVIIPSRSDNYAYAVVECVVNRIPFFTTDVGGNKEIANSFVCLNRDLLNFGTSWEQSDKIEWVNLKHNYNAYSAAEQWLKLHDITYYEHFLKHNPMISVCIPYYNAARYIESCLTSIYTNSYPSFEIILVDDGSTEPETASLLKSLKCRYGSNLHIFHKPNGGPGSARNYAVTHAKGDYLVFIDADNIYMSTMLITFAEGALRTQADCLTAYQFRSNDPNTNENTEIFTPLGACIPSGMFNNTFGDTFSIVRRKTFISLGGFDEKLRQYEDWAFFAKLTLAGYEFDVIPEPLYWYRVNTDGVNSRANDYQGRLDVMKLYEEYAPSLFLGLCRDMLQPAFQMATVAQQLLQLAVQEAKRAHEAAIDETRRAHDAAVAELAQTHAVATDELTRAHKTIENETKRMREAAEAEIQRARLSVEDDIRQAREAAEYEIGCAHKNAEKEIIQAHQRATNEIKHMYESAENMLKQMQKADQKIPPISKLSLLERIHLLLRNLSLKK